MTQCQSLWVIFVEPRGHGYSCQCVFLCRDPLAPIQEPRLGTTNPSEGMEAFRLPEPLSQAGSRKARLSLGTPQQPPTSPEFLSPLDSWMPALDGVPETSQ